MSPKPFLPAIPSLLQFVTTFAQPHTFMQALHAVSQPKPMLIVSYSCGYFKLLESKLQPGSCVQRAHPTSLPFWSQVQAFAVFLRPTADLFMARYVLELKI